MKLIKNGIQEYHLIEMHSVLYGMTFSFLFLYFIEVKNETQEKIPVKSLLCWALEHKLYSSSRKHV